MVSEAGRAFLAERLKQLSDRQLNDLFTVARVQAMGETLVGADGSTRSVTEDDWIRAFRERRSQIVDHRCPN
jgi:hypothetical protein